MKAQGFNTPGQVMVLCLFLKFLEPKRQPLPIGKILGSPGKPINLPAIVLSPCSRNGPSWISSNRSDTWMPKSGSTPIRLASKRHGGSSRAASRFKPH